MKKTLPLIYICIVISILNILMIIFYSRHQDATIINTTETILSAADPTSSDILAPTQIDLAGEPTPLNRLDVLEALKKELIVNTYLHSHTIQILKIAPRIFPILEPILKANGIPEDFKYLAVIESRLDPSVVSPAGAVGVWQIMKGTGEELGLEINSEVDERYNIEKSTEAAAAYLKKAYDKFGSWTLAAASYNAGSSMLSKQMDIQKEKDYYNLLLGEETERYVFRILALKQIMNNPDKYNFKVNTIYPAEPTEKVEVKGSVKSWADFAQEQGVTYKILKRFNPWLRKAELKNPHHKTYQISIPVKKELYK